MLWWGENSKQRGFWEKSGLEGARVGRNLGILIWDGEILFSFLFKHIFYSISFVFFFFFFYFKTPKNKFDRSPFDHKIQILAKLKKIQLIEDKLIRLRSHNTTFSQANKNIVDQWWIDPTWITQYNFQPRLDKT